MKGWKMKNYITAGILSCILAVILILPALAVEEEKESSGLHMEENIIAHGNVNDTVTWKIVEDDSGNHTLIIGGKGPMENYKDRSQMPWLEWKNKIKRLIVEDGVTRIGDYSMYGLEIREVQIGKDVEAIGKYSFAYGTGLKSIRIPGNVKRIESDAFVFHYSLCTVVLEEGVEVLEHSSIGSQASGGDVLHIPASLNTFADEAVWMASGYTVAEENPYFTAENGVLYNKEKTALIDYPKKMAAMEYRIPDNISEIKLGALQRIRATKRIYIPSSVQKMQDSYLFKWADVEEVYVDDGVPLSCSSTFYSCSKLARIRLPENIQIDRLNGLVSAGCNSLESIKIPNGVKQIIRIGDSLKALTEIIYDAENASIKDNMLFDSGISYELTIGENVDYLPKEFLWLSKEAESILFQKPNSFIVEEGAFGTQDFPINQFTGKIHIDEQGVVYQCNDVDRTARILYCTNEYKDLFIPAQIHCDDGTAYSVVSIGKDAFKTAAQVQSIVFEKPEQIKTIEAYGFANCSHLTQINMKNSVEEVEALFIGAAGNIGYHAFYNTGLTTKQSENSVENMAGCNNLIITGEDGKSDLIVTVEAEGKTMEWIPEGDNTGYYSLLTGDTMTVLAAAGNKAASDNQKYRVYFQWNNDDCSLSIEPGQKYSFDDQIVFCYETEDPNCVYIEFSPLVGKTLSIPITAVYPSPNSKGGSCFLWSVSLPASEAKQKEGCIIWPEAGMIRADWKTKKDDFLITNSEDGEKAITLKGASDGTIRMDKDLRWKTVFMREATDISPYGKDYIRNVIYKDFMILPEGIEWKKEVCEAVKEGNVRRSGNTLYAGNVPVCGISLNGGQLNLSAMKLEWDKVEDTVAFSCKVINSNKNAEINTNTFTFTFFEKALEIDISKCNPEENPEIRKKVEAKVFYNHSGLEELTASAVKTVKGTPGTIKLSKSTTTKPKYFGEDINYEIQLINSGILPYTVESEGVWTIQETLSPYMYLEAEAMEKMFENPYGKELLIEILHGEYKEWKNKPGVFKGSIYWENGSNSGVNQEENANLLLRICYDATKTQLQVEADGIVYKEGNLKESLMKAGFAPGRWAEYRLTWTLNEGEEMLQLKTGEIRSFPVYAKVKDTFLMLSEDWPSSYPTDAALILKSTAALADGSGKIKQRTSVSNSVIREVYIGKGAELQGEELKDSFTAENGDCVTYKLFMNHHGEGAYHNIPIVDEMYGSQALLVPVLKNPHLGKETLQIYERDGEEFYILTEGSYQNVSVGGAMNGQDFIASHITVEQVEDESVVEYKEEQHSYNGLYTRIEWDWPELPVGKYRLSLAYDAIVDQKLSGNNVFSLGNIVWMNGKEGSRIHAGLWGGGSIIDFRKEILASQGTNWREDKIEEEGYSVISAGDSVTYRLTLRNKGDGQCEVTGSDLADKLPENGNVFSWAQQGKVAIDFQSTHESTRISNMDQWRISKSWKGDSEEGQEYILWSDKSSIQFFEEDARVYIYVTLSYPDNLGQDMAWERYVQAMRGNILENTFYVYQFPVNVTHHLNEPGKVMLQKGVYGTSYEKDGHYQKTTGRRFYNNNDSYSRQVIYYMFLHNAGAKRWYLNDIYDCLPQGFTFKKFINDSDLNKKDQEYSVVTKTETDEKSLIEIKNYSDSIDDIAFCSATLQWSETKEGYLQFHIKGGDGNRKVSYDEEREQYYLNQNEAVLFGYICETGSLEDTEDRPVNTAFMYYEDFPKTGLSKAKEYPIDVSGARSEIYMDQNDGTYELVKGTEIQNRHHIIYGDGHDDWILSEVSVARGDIIPGITKYTESFTSSGNGLVTKYENAAGPFDQINWRVRLHNSGTYSISDYTFKDILPISYVLGGKVRYELYDYMGNQLKQYELFQIAERKEDKITIINGNSKRDVSLNGEETRINISNSRTGSCSVSKTEQGNEVLTIHFSDRNVSIPEGGYMDIYLSAYNPTNQYNNTVYTNQAMLMPNKQEFSGAGQGSLVKDENQRLKAVKNYAPVTISFGYATGSTLSVLEKADRENQAVSTDPNRNFIILSKENSEFTYELTVMNDTDKPMEKLVLIDNLPEKGDTSTFDTTVDRQSQFQVEMAEAPEIKVMIATETGEYELEKEFYNVSFSGQKAFTKEDWKGLSAWKDNSQDARAVRIVIHSPNGNVIPPKAKITVSFDCKAVGEVSPGEAAWNSFGYHYKLTGIEQELEAMPMPVGVKIADAPKLEKQMEDRNGNPFRLKEDKEFRFILYEGEAIKGNLPGSIPETIEEWQVLLQQHNRNYSVETIQVKAGTSRSDTIRIQSMDWVHGEKYTIAELEERNEFELKNVNGMEENSYTFIYDRNLSETITFVNQCKEWGIELFKTDEEEKTFLKDAVFALYSPNEAEQTDSHFASEKELQIIEQIEKEGQVWYLYDVKTTDSDGKIEWEQLKEEKYYLLEIKAPDGYKLPEEGMIVYGRNAENGMTSLKVQNERGQILPQTGGTGKEMFIAVGAALVILSGMMHHDKSKIYKKENRYEKNR